MIMPNGFRSAAAQSPGFLATNKHVGNMVWNIHHAGKAAKSIAQEAASVPGKVVGGVGSAAKGYWGATERVLTPKDGKVGDIRLAAGAAMVGVPLALGAGAVVSAGQPVYKPKTDYGNWTNNNVMSGDLDAAEMGSYDVNRATESAQRMGIMKRSGWGTHWSDGDLEKNAGIIGSTAKFVGGGANHFRNFVGAFKNPAAFKYVKKPLTENPAVLLGGGVALGAFAVAGDAGSALKAQHRNINTYMNLPSQVPQL